MLLFLDAFNIDMKILVLSDLHLEFAPLELPPSDADLVILAGDIHTKRRSIKWADNTFNVPVVLVPGNHEYWGENLTLLPEKLKNLANGTRVKVLNRDAFFIEGIRILGGTCWTDYSLSANAPLAMWQARQVMRDFKKIREGSSYRKLIPEDLRADNAKFRNWLRTQLALPFKGKTVVVTHHAPSSLSIPQRYLERDSLLLESASYASSLEHEMEGVDLWIHGHTHFSRDYLVKGTRVVCNPRGYAGLELNPDFDPQLVLNI